MRNVLLLVAAWSLLLCACSDDKPTQSDNSTGEGTLLLSRLVVSMVPGGDETVTLCATNADGSPSACSITNSNPSVASVTQSDSTLEITGLAFGTTNVKITSGGGRQCTLPIQVYDHTVLDAGELLITYTDDFAFISNADAWPIYRPIPPAGFVALGAYMVPSHYNPSGREAVMVVQAKPGSNAISYTHNFQSVPIRPGFWVPVPPSGYVAMGTFFTGTAQTPDSAACIRTDLTTIGKAADTIICDSRLYDYSFWRITGPVSGPHEGAYLAPGSFVLVSGLAPPGYHSAANVLNVDLPMLAEAPIQDFVPQLTGYDEPPEWTMPRMSKAMLAPCSIVNDLTHAGDIAWQVANSPFYRLERQVYYRRIYFNYNTGSEVQTNSVTIISGITSTLSSTVWQSTGIELSATAGVSYKAVSGSVTATVSRELGYQTMTSVSELNSTEVSTSINIPPHKAAACWQRYNRYVLYRHSGTELQPVSAWEFGIDSYVVDEYPD